jgi:tetratricopeptide (TPR) repeat protein
MKYSSSAGLNAAYELIGRLYEIEFQDADSAERAMTIAAALASLGEDRSWASVWWAYGALHHDLSDEALARALDLLAKVDEPDEARAAALMLSAEIKFRQAIHRDAEPNHRDQVELLAEAARLAPEWPNVRVRLARALLSAGEQEAARRQAEEAISVATRAEPSDDPFDTAITGTGLRPGWVGDELKAVGLIES